jgi:hypothetical protein
MATLKQHRDNLSLLGLLRGLVGASPLSAQKPSKVAQPGARPAPQAYAARHQAKAGFGQRRRSAKSR